MPRYYFDVADGTRDIDLEGCDLDDLAAARAYAVKFVAEIIANDPNRLWLDSDVRIEVTEDSGALVATVVVLAIDSAAASKVDRDQLAAEGESRVTQEIKPTTATVDAKVQEQMLRLARKQQRKQRALQHALSVITGAMTMEDTARTIIAMRNARQHVSQFDSLGEPAFDMMLGLYIAETEGKLSTEHDLLAMTRFPAHIARSWIKSLQETYLQCSPTETADGMVDYFSLNDRAHKELEAFFKTAIRSLAPL